MNFLVLYLEAIYSIFWWEFLTTPRDFSQGAHESLWVPLKRLKKIYEQNLLLFLPSHYCKKDGEVLLKSIPILSVSHGNNLTFISLSPSVEPLLALKCLTLQSCPSCSYRETES